MQPNRICIIQRRKNYGIKTLSELIENAKELITGVVAADNFVKVSTKAGNAVIISEKEWESLTNMAKYVLQSDTLKS